MTVAGLPGAAAGPLRGGHRRCSGRRSSLWEQLGDATAVDLATQQHGARREGRGRLRPRAPACSNRSSTSSQARGDAARLRVRAERPRRRRGVAGRSRRRRAATITRASPGYREIDDRWGIAAGAGGPGQRRSAGGGLRGRPTARSSEALQAFRELGHQRGVARQLESLSWCASCQSRDEAAVTLASAAAAIRQQDRAPAKQAERERIERTLAQARARISRGGLRRARGGRASTAPLDRILGSRPVAASLAVESVSATQA